MDLLLKVTSLALVDAVNPCTLTVQALLLSALLLTKGRKDALLGGVLFSLTVYVMYLLYGLGILQAIYFLGIEHVLRLLLKILLLVLASLEILAFFQYRPGMVSLEMPLSLRPLAKNLLSSVEHPLMAVPVAALCSILLLPCSSGPYLSALILLAHSPQEKLLLLLYYNLLFTLPMFLITFLVSFGLSPKRVLEWKERHVREIHLLSGLLLLAVFLMV